MELTKKEKIVGIILAILLLFVTVSSTLYFLGKLKVSVLDWVSFNSCAPTSLLYLCLFIIFLIKKETSLLVITFLPTYFLGTMGMFVMPWTEANIPVHIGHIIMTLNLIWILYVTLRYANYKSLAIGLLISIIAFVPYVGYVLSYNQAHAAEIAKLFQQH